MRTTRDLAFAPQRIQTYLRDFIAAHEHEHHSEQLPCRECGGTMDVSISPEGLKVKCCVSFDLRWTQQADIHANVAAVAG